MDEENTSILHLLCLNDVITEKASTVVDAFSNNRQVTVLPTKWSWKLQKTGGTKFLSPCPIRKFNRICIIYWDRGTGSVPPYFGASQYNEQNGSLLIRGVTVTRNLIIVMMFVYRARKNALVKNIPLHGGGNKNEQLYTRNE